MPEYCCAKFKKSIDTSGILYNSKKGYYIEGSLEYGEYFPPINYCPNCGRLLKEPTISEITNGMFNLTKDPKTCSHENMIKYSHEISGLNIIEDICRDCGLIISHEDFFNKIMDSENI